MHTKESDKVVSVIYIAKRWVSQWCLLICKIEHFYFNCFTEKLKRHFKGILNAIDNSFKQKKHICTP